ncbi:pyridoxal-phosphate dependent enzyme [Alteromonas aestuariivivens]|uniref:Pyridoxal-phosphate dependent enzyme n=1 Tax=Alteromonas aestuariivivens TaxID=1938339 RepID=A0A3D8MFL5_9ALTE|nr:pyridoxal-phosphate dependent enzyme [Alteromonas aestuariivivens]RDV29410.1 pyridoxal-phosphate dependent enzyme [Alteromonas aestuariivivens]
MNEALPELNLPSPAQPFRPDWANADSLQIWVKRDDLIHPVISGNKWRKLKYALPSSCTGAILSFGGGYSNHLHALGYACNKLGLPFIAVVRGHYQSQMTPTLKDLATWGARLHFVDRKQYALRDDPAFLQSLQTQFPAATVIPEGGSQQAAIRGVSELLTEPGPDFDVVMAPVGSGATLAGLITELKPHQSAIGVAALKGQGYLEELVSRLLPHRYPRWHIEHEFHNGGFAKASPELIHFCTVFNSEQGFAIEPVYSGKLFHAAKSLIERGTFAPGTRLLLLHTGGLQGARKSDL